MFPLDELSYDRQYDGFTVPATLPTRVLVLADLGLGTASDGIPALHERATFDVSRLEFDELMAQLAPRARVRVPGWVDGSSADHDVEVVARCLEDFEPDALCKNVPEFAAKLASGKGSLHDVEHTAWLLHIAGADAVRRLEATWRSLGRIAFALGTGDRVRLEVLHVSGDELRQDVADENSRLRTLLHEPADDEFGSRISLVFAEQTIGLPDLPFAAAIARIAAEAHAVCALDAAPQLLGLDTFEPRAWNRAEGFPTFENLDTPPEWDAFLGSDAARWLCLCLPRGLLRGALGSMEHPVTAFGWQPPNSEDPRLFCWGSAAGLLTEAIVDCYAETGWPFGVAAARSENCDALASAFADHGDSTTHIGPLEAGVPDDQRREVTARGFVLAAATAGQGGPRFPSAPVLTAARPGAAGEPDAAEMLCLGRTIHTLQCWKRATLTGALPDAGELERQLASWFEDRTTQPGLGSGETAKRPFHSSEVHMEPSTGSPGTYRVRLEVSLGYAGQQHTPPRTVQFDL